MWPAAQEEHGVPEMILWCTDPSKKHAEPAWIKVRYPQAEQTWYPREAKYSGPEMEHAWLWVYQVTKPPEY